MKSNILFVPTFDRFIKLLNLADACKPQVPAHLYYPVLETRYDKDTLALAGWTPGSNVLIDIGNNDEYEVTIPDTISKSDCAIEVYTWKTNDDISCYSQFERKTIIIIDRGMPCIRIAFFEDGSIIKTIYQKKLVPNNAVSAYPVQPNTLFTKPYISPSILPYSYSYSPNYYNNEICGGYDEVYDFEKPVHISIPHPSRSDEKIIVYEYSDLYNNI